MYEKNQMMEIKIEGKSNVGQTLSAHSIAKQILKEKQNGDERQATRYIYKINGVLKTFLKCKYEVRNVIAAVI